jgi:hypothetical protein
MAKIYISYRHTDQELAIRIREGLQALQHTVLSDAMLMPGDDWRATLDRSIRESDAVVVLLTERSIDSQFVMSEIGYTRAYSQATGQIALIPVIVGSISVPPVIQDIFAIRVLSEDAKEIVRQVNSAVLAFLGKKSAQGEVKKETQERIERNAAEYVEETMTLLKSRERSNKLVAYTCQILGLMSLLVTTGFAFYFAERHAIPIGNGAQWPGVVYEGLRGILVIALLISISKYCFSLGKSYMNESLRNSDRIHAISFGKFYLQVFGERATWQEMKEAFQHWNIDTASSFLQLQSGDFDPRFVDTIASVVKSATSGGEKK